MTDHEDLQKRCQRGATNLNDANNLLAECYGVLGKLVAEIQRLKDVAHGFCDELRATGIENNELKLENDALRTALAECTASLEGEVRQKFHGQKPEDMHPVTRREYDRDIDEINGYKGIVAIGTEVSQNISRRGRDAVVEAMSKEG